MVRCGPTDSPHLSGIDLEQLPMEGECGEVRVGIGVELQEGACHLRLQGHGGPGHGMSKPETKAKHGGAPSVQCLCEPLGEPACSHCEVEVRPGVGGQILPGCSPHVAGVGDPAHGVQGSRFPALLWEPPLGGGGLVHMEKIRSLTCSLSRGGRWGSSCRRHWRR